MSPDRDFWRSSGFGLLRRDASGHLAVTDDFLRAYLIRPEILPTDDSGPAEIALHNALLAEPRQPVDAARLTALADEDARDNYRIVLRFRDRLLVGGTLDAAYLELFRGGAVDLPPLFIDHLVNAILRNLLDGAEDPFRVRAAELFFRTQRVSLSEGAVMLADEEIVEQRAADEGAPSLVRLATGVDTLDVLGEENAASYWQRSDRFDMVLDLSFARPGLEPGSGISSPSTCASNRCGRSATSIGPGISVSTPRRAPFSTISTTGSRSRRIGSVKSSRCSG